MKTSQLRAIIASLLVVAGLFSSALQAQEERPSGDPPGAVRIAIMDNYPPYSIIGPEGKPYGLLIDLWTIWSETTDIEVTFVPGTWDETLAFVRDGRADVHSGLYENDQRNEWLAFSTPVGEVRSTFYALSAKRPSSDLTAYENLRIGVISNSHHEAFLTQQPVDCTPLPKKYGQELLRALLIGEIDAAFTEVPTMESILARNGVHGAISRSESHVFKKPLKAAVAKEKSELLAWINYGFDQASLKELAAVEALWLYNRGDRYFEYLARQEGIGSIGLMPGGALTSPSAVQSIQQDRIIKPEDILTREELQWIADNPDITVAAMDAWPPLDFLDNDGITKGIGVDILKLVIERTGLDIRIVPGPFKENLERVRDKELDALLDVSPKPDRMSYVNFTEPYLVIPHVLISRSNGPDYASESQLSGKVVAIERGFFSVNHFRENYPEVIVKEFADTAECLKAVSRGNADAYVGNHAVTMYVIAQNLLTNLEITGEMTETRSVLAIGVRKDWDILRDIMDKALNTISQERMLQILQKWTGTTSKPSSVNLTEAEKQWIKENPVVRVASTEDWPPFEYVDSEGNYSGISADVFREVALRVGLKTEFVIEPWSELIKKLRTGELDVSPGMGKTSTREEYMLFTERFIQSGAFLKCG